MSLQEMHNEIQDVLGQSFALPDGLDEDDLMEELDALEDEMANELESGNRAGVPSYLQVWQTLPALCMSTPPDTSRSSSFLNASCQGNLKCCRCHIWKCSLNMLRYACDCMTKGNHDTVCHSGAGERLAKLQDDHSALPEAPTAHHAGQTQETDEFGLPAVPQRT